SKNQVPGAVIQPEAELPDYVQPDDSRDRQAIIPFEVRQVSDHGRYFTLADRPQPNFWNRHAGHGQCSIEYLQGRPEGLQPKGRCQLGIDNGWRSSRVDHDI